MAEIKQSSFEIVDMIYKAIEKKEKNKFRLARVGASGIGKECLRAIWYGWRGYTESKFDGRILRLFRTGHLQEDRIVNDLKLAGLQVWEIDQSGDQWTYNDETGHFVVKLDGVLKGVPGAEKTPHVLEIKTHNKKSFDDVQKKGVQAAKPDHYDQMHAGMRYSGIHRALYVALCKDNEQYYVERVVYDPSYSDKLAEKIHNVISSTMPPARISEKADFFECKWCDHRGVCWENEEPIRTCRSCEYAQTESKGGWSCGLLNNELTSEDQLKACEHYARINR